MIFLKDSFILSQDQYDLQDFKKINEIINNEVINLIYNNSFQLNQEQKDDILLSVVDLYYNLYLFSSVDFYKEKALEYINNISNKKNSQIYYILINLEENEDKKISLLKELCSKFDNVDPYYYEQLGDYYYNIKDFSNAMNYYFKVINLIPTKKEILYRISWIYYINKDYSSSLNYIDLALKLEDNPDYYYLKGEVLLALNRLEEALQNFNLAYQKYSDLSSKAKASRKIRDIEKQIKK